MNDRNLRDRLDKANKDGASILSIYLAERLISEGKEDGWVFEVYARNLVGAGRYGEASVALMRAEELGPKERRPWILNRRAMMEQQRGNFEEALSLRKAAHAHEPDEATFLISAGIVAFRLGKLSEAKKLTEQGTMCSGGYPDEAWYNLGGYLAAEQLYKEALKCYEKAIEIDPDYDLAIRRRDEVRKVICETRINPS